MKRSLLLSVLFVCLKSLVLGQIDADFSSNFTSGCSPLVVVFSDQSINGTATTWTWDFGNGNTSSGSDPSIHQNPSAIYNTPGTYAVSLTVSDGSSSDTETKMAYITVHEDPVADFSANGLLGCAPYQVDFTDLSNSVNSSITGWFWDFGDGNISAQQNPTNVFMTAALRTVSLVVTDGNGCDNTKQIVDMIEIVDPPNASFTGTPLVACEPPLDVNFTSNSTGNSVLTYQWDFGDGNSSNSQNPINTYTAIGSYDVKLEVEDNLGCVDSLIMADYVGVLEMNANFGYTSSGCAPATLSFTDSSGPSPTIWEWDFGVAGISGAKNPNGIIFSTPGVYQVSLIATNAAGCKDTMYESIVIEAAPVSDFTADITSSCDLPQIVNFTNNAQNATSYFWNFGDGSTSNDPNPSHTYTVAGTYTVSLTVFNSSNCSDAEIKTNLIEIIVPQASFIADTSQGCVPLDIIFTDQSTSNEPIVSWEWAFGDGTTSTDQNPTHTYSIEDSFAVQLIIVNSLGCTDTLEIDPFIMAGTKPTADFTGAPLSTCADSVVYFTDLSTNANKWRWEYGDGTVVLGDINNLWVNNPQHIYTDTGYFDVTMIAYNNGCPDTLRMDSFVRVNPPIAIFSPQISCADPSQVNFLNVSKGGNVYLWDFGDGNTSTQMSPSHQYLSTGQFLVSLNVKDSISGCEYTSYQYVNITALGVDFVADTLSGCIPLAVTFTSSSADAQSWAWDFGNGQTSILENPSVAFNSPGNYDVQLIVTDLNGCRDTMLKQAYISAFGPIVDFSASVTNGCAPLNVQFNDLSAVNGIPLSWEWSFGNGDSAFVQNPSYVFPNVQANYTVSLTITDSLGCTATEMKTNLIQQQKPTAQFISITTAICPSDAVPFVNASAGVGLSYIWDFGDGSSSTQVNPTHVYQNNGLYTVSLEITDVNNCKDTLIRTDYIEVGAAYINFGADTLQANCAPLLVTFSDSSASNVVSWFWDFGDNTSSVLQNPSHLYTVAGEFDITLIITDNKGCKDTLLKPSFIDIDGPSGTFVLAPDSGCAPMEVTFVASAINTVNYTWDFGDGSLGTGDSVTHIYNAGTYFPILVLDDGLGCNIGVDPPDSILVGLFPYTLSEDTIICPGENVLLQADGGQIYTWSNNITLSATNISSPTATPLQSTYYAIEIVDSVGCIVNDTVLVQIDTVIAQVSNDTGVCPQDSVGLLASGGLYYHWTPSNNINNDSISNPVVFPLQNTVYQVLVSDDYCSDSISVFVEVFDLPTIEAGADERLCKGDSVNLTATGALSYIWVPTIGLTNPDSNETALIGDSSLYYYVEGTDTNGCKNSDSLWVTIDTLPIGSVGPDTTLCFGDSVQLSAQGNFNFQWSPSSSLSDTNTSNTIAKPDTSTNYYITITDLNNCRDTLSVSVMINPLPNVSLGPDIEVLLGQTVSLQASGGVDYIWSPSTYLDNTNQSLVNSTPIDDITYIVTVIDENNCLNTEEITLIVYNEAKLAIPKAFTPNGDGKNDFIQYYAKGMAETNLKIFNRWGQLVFEANSTDEVWDGTYNGVELEMETYTYLLVGKTLADQVFTQKGNISLIR